ncbi:E3 ubiquitin-protein ligase ATL4-like [Phragmites australis]|uniref:E3 ubiquitin-protein ligase ATL4-like n=1 Tax=Phragmites australis TaxID=29695 RepID=UPI002D790451|nr:E3 ubiquitin-protein ligase ATL4-like [Phragmites australis]
MAALPPPVAGDPFAATIPPSLPSPSPSSFNLSPSLLIIAALLAFVFFASVSIHFLLRCIARPSSSHPAPSPLPRARGASEAVAEAEAGAQLARRSAAAAGREQVEAEVDDEKERLIASLPLFTMASALAALPKSSPDCAVCLSPFSPDAELRLLPACHHAFHAACVDAWLRTTLSCPLCRADVSLPHPPLPPTAAAGQEPLDSRMSSNNNSRSFRVEIGSVSNRRSSAAGDDCRTYSLGSFDYRVNEEVEAVVARIARPAAAAVKSATPAAAAPSTPGETLAEAAGSRGWLREYVDRLASSASSLSGRWSGRWSQGHHSHRHDDARWSQGHHSLRHDDSWRWDPEAAGAMSRAPDEEEPGFVSLYRWIVGV